MSVLDEVLRADDEFAASEVAIYGYVYDVKTGRLLEVAEATGAGRPS